MLDRLPEEIRIDILSRLPIEMLVRCICVSKSLFSLLISQTFVDAHMKKANLNHLLLRYYSEEIERELYFLQPDNESFDGEFSKSVEFPMERDYESCSILSSVNGVICLSAHYNDIVLWNPSIRKCLSIPEPQGPVWPNDDSEMAFGLGFGFDRMTNDYKVVRLIYLEKSPAYDYELPPKVEVYSVNSGAWRPGKGSGPMRQVSEVDCSQCFLNGVVHWLGSGDPDECVIITFRVHDEDFGEMMMPDSLADAYSFTRDSKLDTCRDMLALIILRGEANTCSVWVMTEYNTMDSWTQIFSLNLPNLVASPRALGFRQNKEIIILIEERDSRHLVLLVDQNGVVINVLGMIFGEPLSFHLGTYIKSLALFKEGKATAHHKACNLAEGNIDALEWHDSDYEENSYAFEWDDTDGEE